MTTSLPTPKMERWKYSNLPAYVSANYDEHPLSVGYSGDDEWIHDIDLSITPWASETYGDMQLWDGLQDVLSLYIPEDMHVDNPVTLSIETSENIKSVGHINITLAKGASLTLYENITADGWCNRSMTITIEEGASLTHIRTGTGNGVVTNLTQIDLAANSKYNAYSLNTYGNFTRDQIHARLNGANGECFLSGSKILKDDQHSDTTILIDHLAPNCHSNQNYRNILNDRSRGVFQGKVYVSKIAQKTDGYQLCNSILLSDRAEMDTKPELEIYADDVKCSHGATTAQMDNEPLFYLMARGIPKDDARNILMQAFVNESLEALERQEEIYSDLTNKLEKALSL